MVIFLGGLRFLVVFLRVVYWVHCFLLYILTIYQKSAMKYWQRYADDAKLYTQ